MLWIVLYQNMHFKKLFALLITFATANTSVLKQRFLRLLFCVHLFTSFYIVTPRVSLSLPENIILCCFVKLHVHTVQSLYFT